MVIPFVNLPVGLPPENAKSTPYGGVHGGTESSCAFCIANLRPGETCLRLHIFTCTCTWHWHAFCVCIRCLHRLMYTFTWSLPHWPDCLIVSDRVFVSSVVGDALLEFEAAASGESKVTALLACLTAAPSSTSSSLPRARPGSPHDLSQRGAWAKPG